MHAFIVRPFGVKNGIDFETRRSGIDIRLLWTAWK